MLLRTQPVVRWLEGLSPLNPLTRKHVLTVGSGQCLHTGSVALHGPVTNASHAGLRLHASQHEEMVAFGIGGTMMPRLIASCPAVTLQLPAHGGAAAAVNATMGDRQSGSVMLPKKRCLIGLLGTSMKINDFGLCAAGPILLDCHNHCAQAQACRPVNLSSLPQLSCGGPSSVPQRERPHACRRDRLMCASCMRVWRYES